MAVIIVTLIYALLLIPLKGIVMLLNFFIDDSIPIIDELVMIVGFLKALDKCS